MKLLFIPNWNGHLYLQEEEDKSVTKLFEDIDFENKELLKIEKNNIKKTNKIIENSFKNNYKNNNKIISITGDHSNSYPLINAFSKQQKESNKFKLIIFDAHPDVEVSTESISHEDYLRNLVDNNIIKPENIYLFGIRTFSRTEFEYLQERQINYFTITDILRDKEKIKKILNEITVSNLDIYLSIDIDVLDPDYAPGTYYTEWCGLYIDELIDFIEIIKSKINCADITEYYSKKDDKNKTTLKNTIKLVKNLLKTY
ncbi:MAG: arginase family protein [Nanoarchaeota archaeon]|nr:arginase family protein [Nanoarchaeota archaeon]